MLLRRMIEHVREQNWTAVFLDFVIVVVGVFIGIQVANWNADREESALERVYLERLRDEALAGINGFLRSTDITWTARRDAMQAAYALVVSDNPDREALSPEECNAIAHTHTIIAFPHQFPSLEELNSSGRFSLLQDYELREHLTRYALMQNNSLSLVNYYTEGRVVMPTAFPAYFRSRLLDAGGAWADEIHVECRLDLMRQDPQFKNTLTEAVSRFNGYYDIVLRPEIDSVERIHDLLDDRLQAAQMPGADDE